MRIFFILIVFLTFFIKKNVYSGSVCTAGARKKGARLKPASSYLFLQTLPQANFSTIDQKENSGLEWPHREKKKREKICQKLIYLYFQKLKILFSKSECLIYLKFKFSQKSS